MGGAIVLPATGMIDYVNVQTLATETDPVCVIFEKDESQAHE